MTSLLAVSSTWKELLRFRVIRSTLVDKTNILRASSKESTVNVRRSYETNLDKNVWQNPVFDKGNFVYLQDDSLWRGESSSHKLQPEKSDWFGFAAMKPKTISIRKDGIEDTVKIDRVAIAWRKNKSCRPPQPRMENE